MAKLLTFIKKKKIGTLDFICIRRLNISLANNLLG